MLHLSSGEVRFHHVGCLTSDIQASCVSFRGVAEDVQVSEVHQIAEQKVKVCFVGQSSGPLVEFVQPLGENGSLAAMLRRGVRFYHTAYLCASVATLSERLEAAGWRMVNSFKSEAFEGALCAFFVNEDRVLIELIEQPE